MTITRHSAFTTPSTTLTTSSRNQAHSTTAVHMPPEADSFRHQTRQDVPSAIIVDGPVQEDDPVPEAIVVDDRTSATSAPASIVALERPVLSEAQREGSRSMLRRFITAGWTQKLGERLNNLASLPAPDRTAIINQSNADDHTLLVQAIISNNRQATERLCSLGVDTNGADSHSDNMTPLHWAAKQADEETARLLLNNGATESINKLAGREQLTPLHLAAKRENGLPIVSTLVDCVEPAKRTEFINRRCPINGFSALDFAIGSGNIEMVRFLLDKGANPQKVDAYGKTPLQLLQQDRDYARYINSENRIKIARLLINYGASPKDLEPGSFRSKVMNTSTLLKSFFGIGTRRTRGKS